jgi:hypothetical protein
MKISRPQIIGYIHLLNEDNEIENSWELVFGENIIGSDI